MDVNDYRISIPDRDLTDLAARLATTRWPRLVADAGWSMGSALATMTHLRQYWMDGFDWRQQEAQLNRLPQKSVRIDGKTVHFLHFRAAHPGALPIVLTHGWPSSFLELVPLARRLCDPTSYAGRAEDAFDVVVPSLPGYGFCEPRDPGFHFADTHELWHRLMVEVLGYDRYAAHGGDLGAGVTSRLGAFHADAVVGIHLLAVADPPPVSADDLTADERRYRDEVAVWEDVEGAYEHLQMTRPYTPSYALSDSPVGLLAWLVEKYRAWSDCGGDLSTRFSDDEILTQVSLYWFTNTIASSFRPYFDHRAYARPHLPQVTVATAVAVFPADLVRPPRSWAERSYNVRQYTQMPRGGHFAAHEEPDLLAADIRTFFAALR